MAVAFHLSSPSFIKTRISRVAQRLQLNHVQKTVMYSQMYVRKKKCEWKLFVLPWSTISHRNTVGVSATIKSIEINEISEQNDVSSGVSTPMESRRSYNLPSHLIDLEKELGDLFDEVKNNIRLGHKDDAIKLLQANYEMVKEQMTAGAKGIEEAAVLDVISQGYVAVGDTKYIGSALDMLEKVVISLKDEQPWLDSILLHMGSMYFNLGKFTQSLLAYERAVGILENTYGKGSTYLIRPLLAMAKTLSSLGRTTTAADMYQHAIAILESTRGTENADLVIPLLGLGNLFLKEGKAMDAETQFSRVLNIYKKQHGQNDGRVGMAMFSLAHAKCAKGNVDEAIELYRAALKIIEDSNHTAFDDSAVEKMRIDLAELFHAFGRVKEGRQLLEECLLITENREGQDHPSVTKHMMNLAASYSNSKDYVEAERLLRRSLQIMTKNVASDDPAISFPMLHLAVTLYHMHKDEEAEQLALEVLRIRENAFCEDSLPVGEALDCLVSIQSRLDRDEGKLLELLQRILSIQERKIGYESQEVVGTLEKIIFYLNKLGRKNEKFPLQRRLSILKMKYK